MAGYGTDVIAPEWADDLIRVLLRAAQRRSARLETLEMHYRRRSEGPGTTRWDIWIDGSGWLIAAWSQQLDRDLPLVAEGFGGDIPTAQAVRIAKSLVARWHDLVVPDDYPRRDPYRIRTTMPDEVTHQWGLLYWPEPNQLTDRLLLSDTLVARWLTFDLPEEAVIEEVHTMAERVLRVVTASGQRVTFVAMVDRARDSGLLTAEHSDTLKAFNATRREFRHRGRTFASDDERPACRDEIFDAFYVLYRLLAHTGDEA